MADQTISSSPSYVGTIGNTAEASLIQRFQALLVQTQSLIALHGPYTILPNRVFARRPTPNLARQVSLRTVAFSLHAAKECHNSPQPDGPAHDDLEIFTSLWRTSLVLLELILDIGVMESKALGWGVLGLAAGYHAPSSVANSTFAAQRTQLRLALNALQSASGSAAQASAEGNGSPDVHALSQEVSVCARSLVQEFRADAWQSLHWFYIIVVAERWAEKVGYLDHQSEWSLAFAPI